MKLRGPWSGRVLGDVRRQEDKAGEDAGLSLEAAKAADCEVQAEKVQAAGP